MSYEGKGDWVDAIAEYTAALKAEPNNPLVLEQRGNCYVATRAFDLALRDYETGLRAAPQGAADERLRSSLWRGLAEAHGYKGDVRLMWSDFDQAIKADPRDAGNYLMRGAQYEHRGNKRAALSDYSEAIVLWPSLEPAYVERGVVHDDLGERAMAVSDYTRALAIKPNDANALNDRCFSLSVVGHDLAKALNDCTASLGLSSIPAARFYPLTSRALTYLKLHRYHDALADANAALQIAPRDPDSHYLRGKAEIALGDVADGKRDIGEAEILGKQRVSYYRSYGLK